LEFAVDAIAEVAARDESIARVLREICSLDAATRASALDFVKAYLGDRATPDVLDCLDALREDDLARRLAERIR